MVLHEHIGSPSLLSFLFFVFLALEEKKHYLYQTVKIYCKWHYRGTFFNVSFFSHSGCYEGKLEKLNLRLLLKY